MAAIARNTVIALVTGAAFGAGGAVAFVRLGTRQAERALGTATAADAEGAAEPAADWCAPGFDAIDGGACLALPRSTPARALIVYLHGRYASDATLDEVDRQRRLASRATARNFAVVAFRGRLGRCTAPELANWYCWPSNETNADAGAGVVDSWERGLAAAHEQSRARRRYLLGFSNGGYFAGLIASQGLLAVDAVVVAHGGPVEPVVAVRGTPPVLLLSADDDVAQDEMIRFDEELARAGWSHDSYARGGAHGLADEDIDAALTFFGRAGEPLPLQPGLALHRPVRHARDAGGESGIQTDELPSDDGPSSAPVGAAATKRGSDELPASGQNLPPDPPDLAPGDD